MQIFQIRTISILLFFLLFSLAAGCRPKKDSTSAYDLKRVLERFAAARIQTGIIAETDLPTPSDQSLFEEACDVYRLPVENAKLALKEKNRALYESIYGN